MADSSDVVLQDDTIKMLRTGSSPVVDIEGGHWNLDESDGDLRIGDDEYMIKMGVATGGGGAGNGRIWATSDLRLGSGGESVVSIRDDGVFPHNKGGNNLGQRGEEWNGVFQNLSAERVSTSVANITRLNPQYDQEKDYGVEKANIKEAWINKLLIEDSVNSDLVPTVDGYSLGSSGAPWDTLHVKNMPSLSDRRLKTDIEDFEGGLDAVLNLQPVSYSWRDNGDETHLGLVGQEVSDVLPEVVNTPEDDDGHLGVRYPELVAVLVDAIQTQQSENEGLAERVDQQEERIEDQQEQINELQARLASLE